MSPHTPNINRSLFAHVPAISFSSSQENACRDFLYEQNTNTELVPIVEPEQLLMAPDASLIETGYRFNPIGFEALTRTVCSGLAALFNDLAGVGRYSLPDDVRSTDVGTAVGIYNAAMQTRFDSLRERQILVEHQNQSVDGFLGLNHKFLSNIAFFDLVVQTLFDEKPNAGFSRAEIIGRELRLFFIDQESIRRDIHKNPQHTFAAGWYFSNREDSGHAVRASRCIFTKFGPAVSAATAKNRVVHIGADLLGRTSFLVRRTVNQDLDMDIVATNVKKLLRTPLGFSSKRSVFDAAHRKWADYIGKFKVKADLAKTVSKNAAMVGSDLHPRDPISVFTGEALSARNGYDLLCAVLRRSRREYATYRDLLQSMAMDMLTAQGCDV